VARHFSLRRSLYLWDFYDLPQTFYNGHVSTNPPWGAAIHLVNWPLILQSPKFTNSGVNRWLGNWQQASRERPSEKWRATSRTTEEDRNA
jgi:hypothetical protein